MSADGASVWSCSARHSRPSRCRRSPWVAAAPVRDVLATPDFARDVAPIVRETCAGCHRDGGIAPFAFRTERDLASRAAPLVAALEAKPHAALATVVALARLRRPGAAHARRAGARDARPLGALAARAAGRRAAGHARRRAQRELDGAAAPASRGSSSRCRPPYRPAGANGSTDDYRCFLLDPKLASDAFVTSARIAPGATSLVHHVILYRIGAGAVAEANALDASHARAGLDVLRRPRGRRWHERKPARAARRRRLDRRLGARLGLRPPASGHGRLAPRRQPDRDAGALQPAERPPARPLARGAHDGAGDDRADAASQTTLLPAPVELACRTGETRPRSATARRRSSTRSSASAPTRRSSPRASSSSAARTPRSPSPSPVTTCDRTVDRPLTIQSVAGHMHLLGRSIRVDLNPGPTRREAPARDPALELPLAGLVPPREAGQRRPRRRAPRDVPARRRAAPRRAALRALGRGDDRRDVPRGRPGDAPVALGLRILLVSQMYPGPDAPELGTFVADLERGLEQRGHEIARAVVDRRGGRSRHLGLARDVVVTARRFRPDVVYAHFLVPGGPARDARRARARRAHRARPGRRERRHVAARAARRPGSRCGELRAVVAVSDWLRARLEAAVPEARGRTEVIDCGVDLERFSPGETAEAARARARLAPEGNGVRLRRLAERAQERPPARARVRAARRGLARLRRRRPAPARSSRAGAASRSRPRPARRDAARGSAAADVVCQPSLVEPFGLATLEGLASGRSVVATAVGGPPEFVTPEAGVLVDPYDEAAIAAALAAAAALPRPEPRRPRRGRARTTSAGRSSGSRRCSSVRRGRPRRRTPPRARASRWSSEAEDPARRCGAWPSRRPPADGGRRRCRRAGSCRPRRRSCRRSSRRRSDRRDDQVDPEVGELGADQRRPEAAGRVDGGAADRDRGDVDRDERERDREERRAARPLALRRLEDHRDEERREHELDDDAGPVVGRTASSCRRRRRR